MGNTQRSNLFPIFTPTSYRDQQISKHSIKDCCCLLKEFIFFFSWNMTEDVSYLGFIQCLLKLKKIFTLQENAKTIYRTCSLYLLCSKTSFSVFSMLAWNHFFPNVLTTYSKGFEFVFSVLPTALIKTM